MREVLLPLWTVNKFWHFKSRYHIQQFYSFFKFILAAFLMDISNWLVLKIEQKQEGILWRLFRRDFCLPRLFQVLVFEWRRPVFQATVLVHLLSEVPTIQQCTWWLPCQMEIFISWQKWTIWKKINSMYDRTVRPFSLNVVTISFLKFMV